ncbi:LysR family transcriptional regulator [Sorangium sp. So ce726]|uniref:LysR family transcriptional regulator n=1 Tax=Sorangium sp. So ce726 TaxID=3133319 RepID=UPI003F62B60E
MPAKPQDLGDTRWDDVRVFLAVHRHGSLGQAGARLGLDTSTVSRRLTALEASLGARLFDRTRDGLVPTRVAELVLPAAEAMEAAHRRLARDASGAEADAEGVVRLSVAPGFADSFVVRRLPRLRARHPKIRVELDASVRVLDLTRHEADLALRSIRPEGADLVVTKLASARWIAAASEQLVEDAGPVEAWDAVPWIAWDRDLTSFPAARWLARHAPGAEIALRTSFFVSQLTAAEIGLGAVLVPEPYLEVHALAPLRFASALEASAAEWPTDDLWLVGHRALRDVPRVAAVWSFLIDELRSL